MARPRTVSARRMRRLFNLYPPFLFQRIKCLRVAEDFRAIDLRVRRSWLNRNHNGTIFGGTIYAAFDPVLPVMYWQCLLKRGIELQAWLMAGEVRFLKPAAGELFLEFRLTEADLDAAESELAARGKAIRAHEVQALDADGTCCAVAEVVTYLRPLRRGDETLAGF